MTRSGAFIVGSSWIYRQGVKQPLKRLGLTIIGEGETFGEAYANAGKAEPSHPDGVPLAPTLVPTLVLVLIEQADGFLTGLEQLRAAQAQIAGAKLVALADPVTDANILAAGSAGIDALLLPTLSSRMLVNSLQLVLHDHRLFPSLASIAPAPQPVPDPVPAPLVAALDARPAEPIAMEVAPVEVAPFPETEKLPATLSGKVMNLTTPRLVRMEGRPPAILAKPVMANLVWGGNSPLVDLLLPGTPSEREWEILRCVARGGSNKLIARELGIAETTVKVHIKSLLRKLGVSNRTQAAIWALQHAKTAAPPSPSSASNGTNGASHHASSNDEPFRSV